MSKAAANMAGKLVANELRGKVAVGILHPGFNRTQMTARPLGNKTTNTKTERVLVFATWTLFFNKTP